MTQTLAQQIASLAQTQPDAPAYLGSGQAFSWSEYRHRSDRLARLLALGLELARGERIGVLLPDGAGVHTALVACEKAGLIAVGIGPRAGAREIEHLLALTGARALISREIHQDLVMPDFVTSLRERGLPLADHIVLNDDRFEIDRVRVNGVTPAPPAGAVPPERALGSQELFLLNSTSGTSGMPKCVSHDQARWQAFHALAVPHGDLSHADVFMSVVPAPFGFGLWTSHFTPTLLGVPCVVMPRFDAEQALALIAEYRVSVLAAVSTQFIMMLDALDAANRDLSSLRVLFTGGEAVPFERAEAFEERIGAKVLQFYGSNETGAVSGTRLEDSREKRLGTAGRPIPEMNLRLFNEAGEDVSERGSGRPGCKGPTLSRGYFGSGTSVAEANAELIREDGWMMLGDHVTLDDEGYLTVVGRLDDFIIRGGATSSGPGGEDEVASHPDVSLAAAVAMPDPVFGERVCVYVELREGVRELGLEELIAHLRSRRVSKETLPEHLIVVDALPRGSGGKVAKQALRDDIRQRLEESKGEPRSAAPKA